MDMRIPVFVMMVAAAPLALATGTGPTLPEKSRKHPLDTREPRQDVIEDRGGSQDQLRPPTLDTPLDVTPTERPSQDSGTDTRDAAESPASAR
jgi:hypothetical protein